MSFQFPNSPTEGTTYTPVGGYQYVWTDGKWRVVESPQVRATAETRSRIVNGAMQISQENGDIAGGSGWYPADQWSSAGSGMTVFQTVRGGAAPERLLLQNLTKTTLAAGDYSFFQQKIEGIRTSDFRWGTASARQAILRFDANSQYIAGTFSIAVQNGSANRSFLAPFTLPLNVWTTITIIIPGDTTGTWATDTSAGVVLNISCAMGSTYVGVDGWQAGNKLASPSAINGASINNNFSVRNVGLYLDPDATGLAPKWTMPDETEELRACQRYWQLLHHEQIGFSTIASTIIGFSNMLPATMRTTPALTVFAAGTSSNMGTGTIAGIASQYRGFLSMQTSIAGTTFSVSSRSYALNARM